MKIVFISNYINHHQIPFSNALHGLIGNDYIFIQTMPMEGERLAMGWSSEGVNLPYVRCLYEEEEVCIELIMKCDVLLAGWSEREDIVGKRLQNGKLTIRVSERLYREGQWKAISPRGLLQKYKEHIRYRNKNVYLLCTGAYVASDFHLIHAYPGKMFKWGYFPETVYYSDEERASLKGDGGVVNIVWAGRLIPLKHPEYVIKLANDLSNKNIDYHIHLIGDGEVMPKLHQLVNEYELSEDRITFYGACTPQKVRSIMEICNIHLFTSNQLEGWGAVLNEAMNSSCCVVSNSQVGAAPFLINHGKNGMVYQNGSYESMLETVMYLLNHREKMINMGEEAYQTIIRLWNAEYAGKELLKFCEGLMRGQVSPAKEGPLSIAPAISPKKMYQKMIQGMED